MSNKQNETPEADGSAYAKDDSQEEKTAPSSALDAFEDSQWAILLRIVSPFADAYVQKDPPVV